MASIRCGHCTKSHSSAAAVKACSQGNLFSCYWAVETSDRWVEYGEGDDYCQDFVEGGIMDCGAEAIATERGWTCAAGHEHVNAQTRHNEGWDFAEDADEAMGMVRVGIQPFTMDGHLANGPRDFAPSTYALAGVR